jgi:hypothetical protein
MGGNKPLDELYLTWLYSQIGSVKLRDKSRTYWSLSRQLFRKEFFWWIPNDDNRWMDGKDLRPEFLHESGITDIDPNWWNLGCSMFEMLIALSRRLEFETNRPARKWFWRMIENLELEECTDRNYNDIHEREIDEVLERVIWRLYNPNGDGGLFPLENPRSDQREVEILYQYSAYLSETD